jgi:hypothetical protein
MKGRKNGNREQASGRAKGGPPLAFAAEEISNGIIPGIGHSNLHVVRAIVERILLSPIRRQPPCRVRALETDTDMCVILLSTGVKVKAIEIGIGEESEDISEHVCGRFGNVAWPNNNSRGLNRLRRSWGMWRIIMTIVSYLIMVFLFRTLIRIRILPL